MKSLRQLIEKAEKNKLAIGHFNVSDFEQLKAIAQVGIKLNVPVIVGLSEGEREYFGIHHFRDLVASYNSQYGRFKTSNGFWLYTNADHTHSFEKLIEAARVGFDMIIFDASRLPLEKNIQLTKQAVTIVKRINPKIMVEGELGYIGSSSEILKGVPQGAAVRTQDLTKPEEAKRFVEETGVDLLAPAVGNIHGMIFLKEDGNFVNPPLDIERIKKIKEAVKIPLVLHGGSGVSDGDFVAAIEAGVSVIHISTELRLVWRQTLEKALANHQGEVAPYKILPEVLSAMEKLVERRLRLFNKLL